MKRVYGDRYEEAQKAYIKELSESTESKSTESKSTESKSPESESTESESESESEIEFDEDNLPKRNISKEELDDIKKDEELNKRITGTRTIQSTVSTGGKKKISHKMGGLIDSPKGNTSDTILIGTRSFTSILKF
jgi:hypothetical protein